MPRYKGLAVLVSTEAREPPGGHFAIDDPDCGPGGFTRFTRHRSGSTRMISLTSVDGEEVSTIAPERGYPVTEMLLGRPSKINIDEAFKSTTAFENFK